MLNLIKKSFQWEMSCSIQIEGTKTDRHDEVKSRFSRFCEKRIKLQANFCNNVRPYLHIYSFLYESRAQVVKSLSYTFR